jgi:hypothetical protein
VAVVRSVSARRRSDARTLYFLAADRHGLNVLVTVAQSPAPDGLALEYRATGASTALGDASLPAGLAAQPTARRAVIVAAWALGVDVASVEEREP